MFCVAGDLLVKQHFYQEQPIVTSLPVGKSICVVTIYMLPLTIKKGQENRIVLRSVQTGL